MKVQRVEKHRIKSNDPYFEMLEEFCYLAKNLYNHANFLIRQEYFNTQKTIGYSKLDKILKEDKEYTDYRNMPTAQTAQQVLRMVDSEWKSFFALVKDWVANPSKYRGKPRIPKYKRKDGRYILVLTNQNARLKEGVIEFPRVFNGFSVKPKFIEDERFVSFQQARFIPRNKGITLELVYNIEVHEDLKDNGRYLGIDLGVDNLVAVSGNIGKNPFLINGKSLKSINQYYNKEVAHFRKIFDQMNGKKRGISNRLASITERRNRKIDDYMHKASRYIVEYAKENNISRIVIGKNDEWKQEINIGRKNNQHFVQIPHARLIEMIRYKAEDYGIVVELTEEKYTSGTSFLDNEPPIKEFYNKSRRKHRGVFVSNQKFRINADVNASHQMIKKVFPNAFGLWDSGLAYNPLGVGVVNLH